MKVKWTEADIQQMEPERLWYREMRNFSSSFAMLATLSQPEKPQNSLKLCLLLFSLPISLSFCPGTESKTKFKMLVIDKLEKVFNFKTKKRQKSWNLDYRSSNKEALVAWISLRSHPRFRLSGEIMRSNTFRKKPSVRSRAR